MAETDKPIIAHLNDFLDWLDIEKGLSSKTQENYERFIKRFFFWLGKNNLNNLKPQELTPQHVWDYRVFLSREYPSKTGQPLKKTTQNYYLIALRSLLGYFVAKDIPSLAPDKIKLAKGEKGKIVKFLNIEQLKKLFAAPDVSETQGLRNRAILELFFSTGLRIAELVALNREQIKIRPGVDELEISIMGKGGRPRIVYVSQGAINWLEKYLKTREDKEKSLFINYSGKKDSPRRLSARYIERMVKKYAVMAGIPATTTPHVLRHSFATDLLSQGVDIRTIQEFLGHKNILATQIYTHVTNKQLRDVHRKFHGGKDL
jgi:site-specific recombinase XerD